MSKAQEFIEEVRVSHRAGVGVVLVRTREPMRVQEILKEMSSVFKIPFIKWHASKGWSSKDLSPESEEVYDGQLEPTLALAHLDKVDTGMFAYNYPQFYLKTPRFMDLLKIYAINFSAKAKRLYLIAPESYTLPEELQHDIPVIDFSLPNVDELLEIYDEISQSSSKGRPDFSEDELRTITSAGSGMTEVEFGNSVSKAMMSSSDWPNVLHSEFVHKLMVSKTEVVKRSETLEVIPTGKMSEVGGLELLKNWVNLRKEAFSETARESGVDMPKGLLLVGPPGTGKTLSSKAIAGTLELPLIKFEIGRMMGSLVGESEGKIRQALLSLTAMAPCCVLLDEVDKHLGGAHNAGGDSGVSRRIFGSILSYMSDSESGVFFIFSANRATALPSELTRKGRLDAIFSVSLPTPAERRAITKIHLEKRGRDLKQVGSIEGFVAQSKGYVAAEIEAAIKEAILLAFATDANLDDVLLCECLNEMQPLSKTHKEDFEAMNSWARENAKRASKELKDPNKSSDKKKTTRFVD